MGMMWCRRILPRRAVGRPDSSRRRLRRVQVPLHHHADAHLTGSSGSTATTSGWPGSRFETRDPRRRLLQTSYVPCQGTTFSRAEKSPKMRGLYSPGLFAGFTARPRSGPDTNPFPQAVKLCPFKAGELEPERASGGFADAEPDSSTLADLSGRILPTGANLRSTPRETRQTTLRD
jgi:hypothetical protein